MMAKPTDYPGFKGLLAEWNRRLKEAGFADIESSHPSDRVLRRPGTTRRFEQMDAVTRDAKAQFFREVAQRVAETNFKIELEAKILNLYAQGYSQTAIKIMLEIKGHRCKVYYPLYRWLRAWGLK